MNNNKKVHFCPQVDVYQPMGQAILLQKQALQDESTNRVVSFFSTKTYKTPTTHA